MCVTGASTTEALEQACEVAKVIVTTSILGVSANIRDLDLVVVVGSYFTLSDLIQTFARAGRGSHDARACLVYCGAVHDAQFGVVGSRRRVKTQTAPLSWAGGSAAGPALVRVFSPGGVSEFALSKQCRRRFLQA
jgi:late competence protein required for DNA uptake (superfamily II DNA/RNA helicase)